MPKICIACEALLPLGDFYAHPQMADGHLNKCKGCCRSYQAARSRRLLADPETRAAEMDRQRRKARRQYYERKAAGTLPVRAEVGRRWAARNRHKRRAANIVARAVRRGDLVRPDTCEVCDAGGRIEGHHDDYARPLDVRWLCVVCHGETRHVDGGPF